MSKINSNTIKHVALLANLPVSGNEEQIFTKQLAKIVDYIDQLSSVDASNVEPTYNVTGLKNVVAPDKVKPCLEQGHALNNAPQKKDGFFVTKGVFDNE